MVRHFFWVASVSPRCETIDVTGGGRVEIKIKNKKRFLMQIYNKK